MDGYSGTALDYYAGIYYDPTVEGTLYRRDNPEESLSEGYNEGYADIIPAEVYHFSTNFVEGKTYCTYSDHRIRAYYYYANNYNWFDPFRYSSFIYTGGNTFPGYPFSYYYYSTRRYRLGVTEACITIPYAPTPTPTPTATPSPSPTITPNPSPTPCDPSLTVACQLNMELAVGSPLRPLGVSGGDKKAAVVVCLDNGATGIPNQNVTLRVFSSTSNTGGHVDATHSGSRPIGRLDKTNGVTGQDGCFYTKYMTPHISGFVTIEAAASGLEKHKEVLVGLPGLSELTEGDNYKLIGDDSYHPRNHYGSAEIIVGIPAIADAYKVRFYGDNSIPEDEKLGINDISLIFGGKFDLKKDGALKPDWHNLSRIHKYHREGNSVDIRCCVTPNQIPANRRAAFRELALANGASRFLEEGNPKHFHLSFNNESNTVAETSDDPLNIQTPHSFVENTYEVVLDRFATQAEWENWHTRIVEAKAQGNTQLLQKAKDFKRSLFVQSEYVARHRTNAEFIEDVFWSHLFREPTEQESQYWQNYLQNIPPHVPQNRRRARLIEEFELNSEFENLVLDMVDGDVLPAPTPTPTP